MAAWPLHYSLYSPVCRAFHSNPTGIRSRFGGVSVVICEDLTMPDIYQAITDRILECLEQGVLPGVGKPWDPSSRTPLIPCNAVSGRQYNGINVPLLWDMANKRGFSQDRWLTFRQAKEAGGTVRKGERSTLACFYKPMKREILDAAGEAVLDEESNPKEKHFAILRGFNLLNIDQCDGLPDDVTNPPATSIEGSDSVDALDDFIDGCGIKVVHSLDRCWLLPQTGPCAGTGKGAVS